MVTNVFLFYNAVNFLLGKVENQGEQILPCHT